MAKNSPNLLSLANVWYVLLTIWTKLLCIRGYKYSSNHLSFLIRPYYNNKSYRPSKYQSIKNSSSSTYPVSSSSICRFELTFDTIAVLHTCEALSVECTLNGLAQRLMRALLYEYAITGCVDARKKYIRNSILCPL